MTFARSNASCSCGSVSYQVNTTPLIRAYCHCTICQKFNQSPYADITVFRAKDVQQPSAATLDFTAHKLPPVLQRGACKSCQGAAIEYLNLIPFNKLVIVPSRNIKDTAIVPAPAMHIFYDTRQAEVEDNLPKYEGYLPSQIAFGKRLFKSLMA